ncbi:MAG TPA: cytochrome c [Candidatus Acidoferrales bacterium]|nr:cytochrome c [Candidatus Acidoferrales bacterium]
MKKWCVAALVIIVVIVVAVVLALSEFNLSALPEPGRFETIMANAGKHWMVRRAAAHNRAPKIPAAATKSVVDGEMTFGDQCAPCHGNDGRTPTAIGKGMYPRALDLGSPEVQHWSDAELFWIIKNGIRLSGMPGFGKSLSDEQIGNLVNYVRSVKPGAAPTKH